MYVFILFLVNGRSSSFAGVFESLELANAWVDRYFPNIDEKDYFITEMKVIEELPEYES